MMKYHVGSNVPGYLPECDILCSEDIQTAVSDLGGSLREQQEYYWEQCEDGGSHWCECDWCDVASDIEADLAYIADHDATSSVRLAGRYETVCRPPQGPDLVFWIFAIADCDCDSSHSEV